MAKPSLKKGKKKSSVQNWIFREELQVPPDY